MVQIRAHAIKEKSGSAEPFSYERAVGQERSGWFAEEPLCVCRRQILRPGNPALIQHAS